MLCDRCILSSKCESSVPGGECAVESGAFDWLSSELMSQYGLEGLVDEILVGRVAMYLIRIARAEVYEANVGVSGASVAWGRYIVDLDESLRGLLRDLALTRADNRRLERDDVFVDVDRLLSRLALRAKKNKYGKARKYPSRGLPRKARMSRMAVRGHSPVTLLINDWMAEKPKLESLISGV
jgi:hypothetical protein